MAESVVTSMEHSQLVLDTLHQLYIEQQLCDYMLVVPSGEVYTVHKLVLAAASPFFKLSLASGQGLDNRSHVLQGVSSLTMKLLLEFLYTGSVPLNKKNIHALTDCAQTYGFPSLLALCERYTSDISSNEECAKDVIQELDMSTTESKPLDSVVSVKQEILEDSQADYELCDDDISEAEDFTEEIQENQRSTRSRVKIKMEKEKKKSLKTKRSKALQKEGKKSNRGRPKGSRVRKKSITDDSDLDEFEEPEETKKSRSIRQAKKTKSRGSSREKVSKPKRVKEPKTVLGIRKSNRPKKYKKKDKVKILEPKPFKCTLCTKHYYKARYSNGTMLRLHHIKKHNLGHYFSLLKSRRAAALFQAQLKMVKMHSSKTRCSKEASGGKTMYRCKVCNKGWFKKARLNLHIMREHFRYFYQCSKCPAKLNTRPQLVYHRQCHHKQKVFGVTSASKQFPCPCCQRPFLHKAAWRTHIKEMHGYDAVGEPKLAGCTFCPKAFHYIVSLHEHLNFHQIRGEESQIIKEVIQSQLVQCTKTISDATVAIKKTSDIHVFKCEEAGCDGQFRRLQHLKVHMLKAHNEPIPVNNDPKKKCKIHRCEIPGCTFNSRYLTALKDHVKEEHEGTMYNCQKCRFQTPTLVQLQKHMRARHSGDPTRTCDQCSREFAKPYYLKVHKYARHGIVDPSVTVHKCEVEGCDYVCFQRINLSIHMRKHQRDKNFACDICAKRLKTQKGLEKHINKVHLGIRPWICDICGASYGEESELKTHRARHDNTLAFQCEYCEYRTHDKTYLDGHVFKIHKVMNKVMAKKKLTVYRCTQCDYVSRHRGHFENHMKSHLNIRDFICKECGKAFSSSQNFRDHCRWKHMEKLFKCDYCDYTTSTMKHLKEHVRVVHTHPNHKPYKCAYCEYHCTTNGNCRKHVMQRHKGLEVKVIRVMDIYPDNNPGPILAAANMIKIASEMSRKTVVNLKRKLPMDNSMRTLVDESVMIVPMKELSPYGEYAINLKGLKKGKRKVENNQASTTCSDRAVNMNDVYQVKDCNIPETESNTTDVLQEGLCDPPIDLSMSSEINTLDIKNPITDTCYL